MPVLFKEISDDLGLSLIQIGTIWGMASLSGMFVSLPGGLLGDRFGVKRTIVVACFVAGLAGALRGLSDGFVSLAATMFLFGFMSWIIPINGHKVAVIWFTGRHLGMANGILSMGMTVGSMTGAMISATLLSPLLGGWQNVMFLYGGISMVFSLLWVLTGREPDRTNSSSSYSSTVSFRQAISQVAHIKRVWILGFILLGQMTLAGMMGYLPLYLRDIGWTPASADSTIAVFSGVTTIATIPMTMLSDRTGSRKMVLIPALLIAAIAMGLLSVASGAAIWGLIIVVALMRSGSMALFLTMLMETEGIGATYAGTAQGLMITISQLGGFVFPIVGNGLAEVSPSLAFIFWGTLSAVAVLGFYFVKEVRHREGGFNDRARR